MTHRTRAALAGLLSTVAILGSATPAAAKPKDRMPVEEQPLWMRDPQGLKLDIVDRFLERGEPVQALALIAAMRNEGVEDPKLDLLQGIALRDQGMDSEAERLLLAAEKKMGRDARPHAELCILYAAARRVDEAVASCTRATELDGSSAKSWNNLAYVLLGADRGPEALEAAQHAVDIDPSQARYKNNLGFALAANARWDDAFDTFRSVASEADAWYNLGVAYEHHGQAADARTAWQRALEAEPNHGNARRAISGDAAGVNPAAAGDAAGVNPAAAGDAAGVNPGAASPPAALPATVSTPGAAPILVPDPLPGAGSPPSEDPKSSEGDPR